LGDGQIEDVSGLCEAHNWIVERVRTDYHGIPRVLTARYRE